MNQRKNRNPNRLEKLIIKYVRKEIKPHWGHLWGRKSWCVPAYIEDEIGDGRQVVWLKTGDSRPNYYVLRIDSKTDVTDDDFNLDPLLCAIEDKYGNVNEYEEKYIENELMVRESYAEDNEPWLPFSHCDFPMLSISNGMFWGSVKIL